MPFIVTIHNARGEGHAENRSIAALLSMIGQQLASGTGSSGTVTRPDAGFASYGWEEAETPKPRPAPVQDRYFATTIYQQETGQSETLGRAEAEHRVKSDPMWTLTKPPGPGWEKEIPKYKATRDLRPTGNSRHRFETPLSEMSSDEIWQYCPDEGVKAGQTIQTTNWPHPSFEPINYSASRVMLFFNTRPRTQLPLSPWQGDRVQLGAG